MEKYSKNSIVFMDLEKAYDTDPRKEVWYCLRKAGVTEKFMSVM